MGDGVAGTDYDFAETAVQGIEGTVYLDANKNGVDDSNEFGVANVVLTLTGTTAGGRAVTMTATTDSSGHYAFDDLVTGTYKIKIAAPTSIFNNGRITLGMDGGTVQGESVTGIRYTTGEDVDGYDFGELIQPGCRLNTATVRSLLQVGPNATSLPASVRPGLDPEQWPDRSLPADPGRAGDRANRRREPESSHQDPRRACGCGPCDRGPCRQGAARQGQAPRSRRSPVQVSRTTRHGAGSRRPWVPWESSPSREGSCRPILGDLMGRAR